MAGHDGRGENGEADQLQPPGLQVRQVQVGAIAPYLKNAKRHPPKQIQQIANSIREFGFLQPLVLDAKGELVVGHGRLEAAKLLGLESVPAVCAENLTPEQIAAYRLADNKLNESGWDRELVIEELKLLDEKGFDIELTGFDRDLILVVDESNVPEAPKEPTSKPGELYRLGGHRLLVGDSTNPDDVARLMGGERAAMVFTDPPYNVAYEGGGSYAEHGTPKREAIANDDMSAEDFYSFLLGAMKNAVEHCDGGIYVCMASSELTTLRAAFEAAGGKWSNWIVWVKNTFTLSRSDWQHQHEPILYGWPARVKNHYFAGFRDEGNVWENLEKLKPEVKDGKTVIRVGEYHIEIEGEEIKGRVIRKREATDIWREKKPAKSGDHPTMKPVRLVAKAVKASSRPGDIVLDLFGGSGSTLMACEELGRRAFLSELEPKYADVIIRRWEEATGGKAELAN